MAEAATGFVQKDQIKGMADRAVAVLATTALGWLVKRGYIGESDAATLLPGIILLPSLAWGWWVNRDKALVQSAANVPNTVVLTTPAMANATPFEPNIISNTSSPAKIASVVADAKAPINPAIGD